LPIGDFQTGLQSAIENRQLPDRRDAAVAKNVVLNVGFGHYFRHLKLAQDSRRPNPMRLTLADSRVVHAHEFRGGRHHDFAVNECQEPGPALSRESQLEGNRWILLG